jgi:hypothetical protein
MQADEDLPGNPSADNSFGYPAPQDLTIYIWCRGEDLESNQLFNSTTTPDELKGGGDDINNWDNKSGWEPFYS